MSAAPQAFIPAMNTPLLDRKQYRQQLRQFRRNLTPLQQTTAARRLAWKLARHPAFISAKNLALYWPSDGEISPLPLMRIALARGKQCYLPRLTRQGHTMEFAAFAAGDRLHTNRFGIKQPSPCQPRITPAAVDLMLMPLVGFDQAGNRLGMGGGFYDRVLAGYRGLREIKLVGLAHQGQQLSRIAKCSWDVPLHLIATDRTILRACQHHTPKKTLQ